MHSLQGLRLLTHLETYFCVILLLKKLNTYCKESLSNSWLAALLAAGKIYIISRTI